MRAEYTQGADLPDLAVDWYDSLGEVIDFSTGYTFAVKVWSYAGTAITKTGGITGDDTLPNVTVAWSTTGELNTIDPGNYRLQIIATRTADSKNRIMHGTLTVIPGAP